ALLGRIRGWNFTKSAIEAAMFQVLKKRGAVNLSDALHAPAIAAVPVGISLGIYQDPVEFYDVVQQAIASGYRRLKFKIAPFVDPKIFDYINPLLFAQPTLHLGFDANGSFGAKHLDQLRYFVDTYHTAIEQPTPPNRFDLLLLAKQKHPRLEVCFDEEVKSIGDLVKLKSLNAIDELNLKIGRVGGISNSVQLLNYCYEQELACWIGGMFETGVGRLLNLSMAAHLPQAKAHDLSPSSRYFEEDIVSPAVKMEDGQVSAHFVETCDVLPEILDKYTTQRLKVF
ncbi:MAG: enolase C-terminal domain-like protein, partial [Bacteroidota bacterium]